MLCYKIPQKVYVVIWSQLPLLRFVLNGFGFGALGFTGFRLNKFQVSGFGLGA